jgi:hypothetical protein
MSVEVAPTSGAVISYEEYAGRVLRQVQYDDETLQTIGGVPVVHRLHTGFLEEWAELYGSDSTSLDDSFGYSRFDALRSGAEYTTAFTRTWQGRDQINLHISEFGDGLWYLTNYLNLFGISLDETMYDIDYAFDFSSRYDEAMLLNSVDAHSHPVELVSFTECARDLLDHMGAILDRSSVVTDISDTSKHTLKQLARQYIESMVMIVETTFGVGIEAVMLTNLSKIDGRLQRGTIFGAGDSR